MVTWIRNHKIGKLGRELGSWPPILLLPLLPPSQDPSSKEHGSNWRPISVRVTARNQNRQVKRFRKALLITHQNIYYE